MSIIEVEAVSKGFWIPSVRRDTIREHLLLLCRRSNDVAQQLLLVGQLVAHTVHQALDHRRLKVLLFADGRIDLSELLDERVVEKLRRQVNPHGRILR